MKRGALTSPKLKALARELKVPIYAAVGILEMLWHFTAHHAYQGNVGRFGDADIAEAVGWPAARGGPLTAALVKAGWLDPDPDYRLLVHDWKQHADNGVRSRLRRDNKDFLVGQCPTSAEAVVEQSLGSDSESENDTGGSAGLGLGTGLGGFSSLQEGGAGEGAAVVAVLVPPANGPPAEKPSRVPRFHEFWALCPKQVNPGEAEPEWDRLTPMEKLAAMHGMGEQRVWPKYVTEGFEYMQDPHRWLRNKRWFDKEPQARRPAKTARNLEAATEAIRRHEARR